METTITKSKKSVLFTTVLSFLPFVPLGSSFLYLGKTLLAIVFFAFHIILAVVFYYLDFLWQHVADSFVFSIDHRLQTRFSFFLLYNYIIILLSIVTHIVCLGILRKTEKVPKLGLQIVLLKLGVVIISVPFVFEIVGWQSFFPWFLSYSLNPTQLLYSLTGVFVWLFISNALSKVKKNTKQQQTETIPHILELDKLHDQCEFFGRYVNKLRNTKIHVKILNLYETTEKIILCIEKHPHEQHNLIKFASYCLPNINKLLGNYIHIKQQSRSGATINRATKKIEGLIEVLQHTYNNQLNALFEGKALDTDTQLDMLKNILEKEGLLEDNKK